VPQPQIKQCTFNGPLKRALSAKELVTCSKHTDRQRNSNYTCTHCVLSQMDWIAIWESHVTSNSLWESQKYFRVVNVDNFPRITFVELHASVQLTSKTVRHFLGVLDPAMVGTSRPPRRLRVVWLWLCSTRVWRASGAAAWKYQTHNGFCWWSVTHTHIHTHTHTHTRMNISSRLNDSTIWRLNYSFCRVHENSPSFDESENGRITYRFSTISFSLQHVGFKAGILPVFDRMLNICILIRFFLFWTLYTRAGETRCIYMTHASKLMELWRRCCGADMFWLVVVGCSSSTAGCWGRRCSRRPRFTSSSPLCIRSPLTPSTTIWRYANSFMKTVCFAHFEISIMLYNYL